MRHSACSAVIASMQATLIAIGIHCPPFWCCYCAAVPCSASTKHVLGQSVTSVAWQLPAATCHNEQMKPNLLWTILIATCVSCNHVCVSATQSSVADITVGSSTASQTQSPESSPHLDASAEPGRILVATFPFGCSHTMQLLRISNALLQRSHKVMFVAPELDKGCIDRDLGQFRHPNLTVGERLCEWAWIRNVPCHGLGMYP